MLEFAIFLNCITIKAYPYFGGLKRSALFEIFLKRFFLYLYIFRQHFKKNVNLKKRYLKLQTRFSQNDVFRIGFC